MAVKDGPASESGKASVAVHDEGAVLRDRSRTKDSEHEPDGERAEPSERRREQRDGHTAGRMAVGSKSQAWPKSIQGAFSAASSCYREQMEARGRDAVEGLKPSLRISLPKGLRRPKPPASP